MNKSTLLALVLFVRLCYGIVNINWSTQITGNCDGAYPLLLGRVHNLTMSMTLSGTTTADELILTYYKGYIAVQDDPSYPIPGPHIGGAAEPYASVSFYPIDGVIQETKYVTITMDLTNPDLDYPWWTSHYALENCPGVYWGVSSWYPYDQAQIGSEVYSNLFFYVLAPPTLPNVPTLDVWFADTEIQEGVQGNTSVTMTIHFYGRPCFPQSDPPRLISYWIDYPTWYDLVSVSGDGYLNDMSMTDTIIYEVPGGIVPFDVTFERQLTVSNSFYGSEFYATSYQAVTCMCHVVEWGFEEGDNCGTPFPVCPVHTVTGGVILDGNGSPPTTIANNYYCPHIVPASLIIPTATIISPSGSYLYGDRIQINVTVDDHGTPVTSVVAMVDGSYGLNLVYDPLGHQWVGTLTTLSTGQHTFVVTATNAAGYTSATSVFNVYVMFGSFLSPLDSNHEIFRVGRVLPVKFTILGVDGPVRCGVAHPSLTLNSILVTTKPMCYLENWTNWFFDLANHLFRGKDRHWFDHEHDRYSVYQFNVRLTQRGTNVIKITEPNMDTVTKIIIVR